MKTFLFTIAITFILSGCLAAPDLQTGENCWRYSVAMDNTGRMTDKPISDIPVIKVDYDGLVVACGLDPVEPSWSNRGYAALACFKPGEDKIYTLKGVAGKVNVYEEQCHALLGREHNGCSGYGIGSDESACEW